MVAVDRTATTSAAAVPVHRPAMAPCPILETAGRERSTLRAAASATSTGAHNPSSTPRAMAASYSDAGHGPVKRSGNPIGPNTYARTPRAAPVATPIATVPGAAGDLRAVQTRMRTA